MTGNARRTGKAQALRDLADHVGLPEPSSSGGTVPKSWLQNVIAVCYGRDVIPSDCSKRDLVKLAFDLGGGEWRDDYVTQSGSTVTGEALTDLISVLPRCDEMSTPGPEPEQFTLAGEAEMAEVKGSDQAQQLEDLEALFVQIADHLATLAATDETPATFDPARDQFEASEVRFDSSAWLLKLWEVQGWLYLDTEMERAALEADAYDAARGLFRSMGVEPADNCTVYGDAVVGLSLEGATELAARLDSAVFLRDRFMENVEILSRAQATELWIEAWEEEDAERADPEPIKAQTAIWPIQEFAYKAKTGRLNLSPSYQRADVWPTPHSQELIISILRGIPLPSVILLKPKKGGSGALYEVVDGKQRLTAILRFIGQHPKALERLDEAQALQPTVPYKETFEEDYRQFRRLWKTHRSEQLTATKEAEYYFPFLLPKKGNILSEDLRGRYYCEIRDVPIQIGNDEETVREVFDGVGNYKIPLIEYLDTAPRQIHDVFHLYNRQGKKLNAEEIRNALFHHLDIMRLLLVSAGDNPDVENLVPFIPEDQRWQVAEMGEFLTEYRFGTARYRRTKLLSWLAALLFRPSLGEDGEVVIRSTAKQIDELLHAVESDPANALADQGELRSLVEDLHSCLEVHSAFAGWAPVFQDDKTGAKWQELQLVASLVGVFLISVMSDDPDELLSQHHSSIFEFTSAHKRPEKTQNKTQWGFIGKVALGLVDEVGIDLAALDQVLNERYGISCVPTLQAASKYYKPRLD